MSGEEVKHNRSDPARQHNHTPPAPWTTCQAPAARAEDPGTLVNMEYMPGTFVNMENMPGTLVNMEYMIESPGR